MSEKIEKKKKIIAHDLWKRYGSQQVLKGLSLDIYENETLVILGRSGAGKSVLLRQIMGLEKPDKGYVDVDGIRVTEVKNREQNPIFFRLGFLFQGAALFDSLNVAENVAFFLKQHPDPTEKRFLNNLEIAQRVKEALKMVGLDGIEEKMPSNLSGGMKKRVALARLIVYRPNVLLYDEPTAGLDPVTAMNINALITKMKNELNVTSIVVTHDIRSAIEIGDRLAFHHEGKIKHIAEKDKFLHLKDPVLQTFFNYATVPEEMMEKNQ